MYSTLSHYVADRLPARNAIGPVIPTLLSPSSQKFKRIDKALEDAEKTERLLADKRAGDKGETAKHV